MTWPGNPAGWLTPEEWQAVRLSLEVALRSVVFGLPPAVLAAWLLARHRFPGRALLDAFVHLPLVMPPVVVGWLLLDEKISFMSIIGAVLITLGVIFANKQTEKTA